MVAGLKRSLSVDNKGTSVLALLVPAMDFTIQLTVAFGLPADMQANFQTQRSHTLQARLRSAFYEYSFIIYPFPRVFYRYFQWKDYYCYCYWRLSKFRLDYFVVSNFACGALEESIFYFNSLAHRVSMVTVSIMARSCDCLVKSIVVHRGQRAPRAFTNSWGTRMPLSLSVTLECSSEPMEAAEARFRNR